MSQRTRNVIVGAVAVVWMAVLVAFVAHSVGYREKRTGGAIVKALPAPAPLAPPSTTYGTPKKGTSQRDALFRADLARMAQEYAIRVPRGTRFDCAVVPEDKP